MKQRLQKFFEGRQGMDELSKALFWGGLAALLLSGLCIKLLNGALSTVLSLLGLAAVIFCFVRAFSRRLAQRETENNAFLAMRAKRKREWEARKDRFRQRKNYKFFKCPCKCGYILYRKT